MLLMPGQAPARNLDFINTNGPYTFSVEEQNVFAHQVDGNSWSSITRKNKDWIFG